MARLAGFSFPLRFGPLGHFERAEGSAKIRGALSALVLTTLRERVMSPKFGTLGTTAVFRTVTRDYLALMRAVITEAVANNVKEIVLSDVAFDYDQAEGRLTTTLTYRARSSSDFDSLDVLLDVQA